ncbi:hypothetical protein BH10PSE17_BH10PSE17_28770 [soil metagenome]
MKMKQRIRDAASAAVVSIAVSMMAGCATPPAQLVQVHEAFPDPSQVATGTGIPPEATKSAIYEASFEDVFRVANVSASQAQLNVEEVQKKAGQIFATRSAMITFQQSSTAARFYYVISVKELAAKRTQVRIAAKVQGKCETIGSGFRVFTGVLTLGVSELGLGPLASQCKELSTPNWALDKFSAETEMGQFQTFMRNSLIASGLM